jgi:hypothetical protein
MFEEEKEQIPKDDSGFLPSSSCEMMLLQLHSLH